jgi:hypothetical protein
MEQRLEDGALHTFSVSKRGAANALITKDVKRATKLALEQPKSSAQLQGLPFGMLVDWALNGGDAEGGTSKRDAMVAIMEGLAANEAFWEYTRKPTLGYNIKDRWEKAAGELKVHFTPRLQQLLNEPPAAAK